MKLAIPALLLLAAAPAFAQPRPPGTGAQGPTPPMPNLANPQAEANQAQQAPNAGTSRNVGNAPSIPTPELGHKETPTPQR